MQKFSKSFLAFVLLGAAGRDFASLNVGLKAEYVPKSKLGRKEMKDLKVFNTPSNSTISYEYSSTEKPLTQINPNIASVLGIKEKELNFKQKEAKIARFVNLSPESEKQHNRNKPVEQVEPHFHPQPHHSQGVQVQAALQL